MSDHLQNTSGRTNLLLSTLASVIAWVSVKEVQVIAAIAASVIAAISGVMAARYYWFAGEEKRQSIKKLKS